VNKDLLATCTLRELASGEVHQRGRMRGRARRTASARRERQSERGFGKRNVA